MTSDLEAGLGDDGMRRFKLASYGSLKRGRMAANQLRRYLEARSAFPNDSPG